MKKVLTLRDLLPFISYGATLQIMEISRAERNRYGNFEGYTYDYVFPESDLIMRGTIEQCYPELLDREIADGIHGEGEREGIYIHLYKDPERRFKTYEEPFAGRIFTASQMHEFYRDLVDKAEYPDFSVWFVDMLKAHIFEEVKE